MQPQNVSGVNLNNLYFTISINFIIEFIFSRYKCSNISQRDGLYGVYQENKISNYKIYEGNNDIISLLLFFRDNIYLITSQDIFKKYFFLLIKL